MAARTITATVAIAVLVGGVLASAPASASVEVRERAEVEVSGRTVSVEGDDVAITLPGTKARAVVDASLAPSERFDGLGGPLLNTTVGGATISTYATNDGTQTLIEIPSASAAREYRFPLDIPEGGESVLRADGSVAIFDASGNSLGGFYAPWAVDADGNDVPTSYRLSGQTLIQTVDTRKVTAFPVLADPQRGTAWWGVWFRYSKAETKKIANALKNSNSYVVKDMLTAACGLVPGWTAGACAIIVQAKWYLTMQPAIDAAAKGKCIILNIPYFFGGATMNTSIVKCTS